jgi:antitoxin ChpS
MHTANLVVYPQPKSRYTLDELLAQCPPTAAVTGEDSDWLDIAPVGHEL